MKVLLVRVAKLDCGWWRNVSVADLLRILFGNIAGSIGNEGYRVVGGGAEGNSIGLQSERGLLKRIIETRDPSLSS